MITQANVEIKVTVRSVYGKDAVYPVCDTAHALLALTGRKTFTDADLAAIRRLGYRITVVGGTAPDWVTHHIG